MTTTYGPAQRLDEQIDILLHDPDATDIVVLSMMGEPAIPKLSRILDADTKAADKYDAPGRLAYGKATVIIRVLGMIAHPTVVPPLGRRLEKMERRSRDDSAETRAIVNALRKVGDETALRALVNNLCAVDLPHARLVLENFGERAREALLAKLANPEDRSWSEAAKLLTTLGVKEAIPLLKAAAEGGKTEALALLAYYGRAAPTEWAVRRLIEIQPAVTTAYLRSRRSQDAYYYGHARDAGHPEHDALLRILHHAGDPSVLRPLLSYFAIEHPVGITSAHREPGASVTLLALTFGKNALPYLADAELANLPADAREGAAEVRKTIENGTKVTAGAFRIEKSPLGDEDWKPQPDYIPARPSTDYGDDE